MSRRCPCTLSRAVRCLLATALPRAGAQPTLGHRVARDAACLVRSSRLAGTIAQAVAVLFRQGWLRRLPPMQSRAAGAVVA